MDETRYKMDILFGHIQLLEMPPRVDGERLYPRGRSITYDRQGNVTKDETYELGHYILGWEDSAHLFGVAAPRKTWWQRLTAFLC